jgi:hypothetical protein
MVEEGHDDVSAAIAQAYYHHLLLRQLRQPPHLGRMQDPSCEPPHTPQQPLHVPPPHIYVYVYHIYTRTLSLPLSLSLTHTHKDLHI